MGLTNHTANLLPQQAFPASGVPATLTEAKELAAMYYIITGQTPANKEGQLDVEQWKAKLENEGGIKLQSKKKLS